MIDPDNVPDVEQDEMLARFVLEKKLIYYEDKSAKPRLFYPYKYVELSVNRHRDCIESEVWEFGSLGVWFWRGKIPQQATAWSMRHHGRRLYV